MSEPVPVYVGGPWAGEPLKLRDGLVRCPCGEGHYDRHGIWYENDADA